MTEQVPAAVPVKVVPLIEQYAEPAAIAYVTSPEPLPPLVESETLEPLPTLVEPGTTVNALCALFTTADVVNERVPEIDDNAFLKLSILQ